LTLEEFAARHMPALEADEARYNLILGLVAAALKSPEPSLRYWSLGEGGACAIQTPGKPLALGAVGEGACRRFAEMCRNDDFPGVGGSGDTALRFAEHAAGLGIAFSERIPLQILALRGPPRAPVVEGEARPLAAGDTDIFCEWRAAFAREATPWEPLGDRKVLEDAATRGTHLLWVVDGAPVAIASIGRRTQNAAVINGVYTPPERRGRGYAAALTAALVDRGYAEGKAFACLYVDQRNPASNRCYAKLGFAPVCEAWHCVRG
jgi:GNAT superfamily N-acetyltransferase